MELIWDDKRKKHVRYYPPNDPEYYIEGLTKKITLSDVDKKFGYSVKNSF